MESAVVSQAIRRASLAHIGLIDEFIQVTEALMRDHGEAFVQESLGDLLESLRAERDGYLDRLVSRDRARAA